MKKLILLILLFSLSLFSATARVFSVRATLNGANVVPPTSSTGIGTMTGTYDDVSKTLSFTVTFSGLSGTPFNGYIDEGNSTFIQSFNVNTSPYSTTISSFTNAQSAVILAGNSFMAIETNPMGSAEIRGQIIIGMEIFNNAAQNNFYGLGGYSYSQTTFPNGVQANPYIVSGPSPQNDFSYAVSAVGGITNRAGYITATNTNTPLTIQFYGNNIRKFGCSTDGINIAVTATTSDVIRLTATTNLGAVASQTSVNGSRFVGFSVTNENEYLVSVTVQFNSTPSPAAFLSMQNIILGDNTPQNVALNFDGGDDYVSIPSTVGNFNTSDNFTVTCWIKPHATQPSSAVNPNENDIISKWAGLGAGINNNYPFVIRYLNSANANPNKILVGQWDGTTFTTVTSTTAVNDGKWHHVAFVRGASGFSLYIDGTLQGTAVADNVTGSTNNTTPLQIGRRGNGQNYFRGEIDEVRIWNVAKTAMQIDDEKFCKTPLSANLVAFYNFNNGVPHDNNALITQVQDAVSPNHGTLNNFAKTDDASNFVTGQVKYVNAFAAFGLNNGSSWANAFTNLQSALSANTCNDLFDVYVSANTYKPGPPLASLTISFEILEGMRLYGGFAGTEKSINQRNMALIHTTNKTTLSGDFGSNDTAFNFTINRGDNSNFPVDISGNNVVFDGFTVSGSSVTGAGIGTDGTNATIKNSRVIDNTNLGFYIFGGNATIANCSIMGNNSDGFNIQNSTATIKECLIANNGFAGIFIRASNGNRQTTITNSTIASNADYGISVTTTGGTSTNTLKNTLIYGNASGGILNDNSGGGTITNTITYSLVQGITTGTGNLNGNTVNPQFVSSLANTVVNITGDYRLKDISPCINRGDNTGVSPLDLDRNVRPKDGGTDMGAYEAILNPNEIISIITGNWESNSTWNLNRIPLFTDKVIVNGHQVTVTTNAARAKNLEYKTGAILRYLSGGLLRFGL